jgi:hypothetical protein
VLWDHRLRVFNIGGKDLATWEWHGPWIYMLNEHGVNEFVPKWLAGQGQ